MVGPQPKNALSSPFFHFHIWWINNFHLLSHHISIYVFSKITFFPTRDSFVYRFKILWYFTCSDGGSSGLWRGRIIKKIIFYEILELEEQVECKLYYLYFVVKYRWMNIKNVILSHDYFVLWFNHYIIH